MPARGFSAGSGLSAEGFLAIAADPERYRKELAQFATRKAEAEAAEEAAATLGAEVNARREDLESRETVLAEQAEGLSEQATAQDKRSAQLDAREEALAAAEDAIVGRESAVLAREPALTDDRALALRAVRVLTEGTN